MILDLMEEDECEAMAPGESDVQQVIDRPYQGIHVLHTILSRDSNELHSCSRRIHHQTSEGHKQPHRTVLLAEFSFEQLR